jgi:hypothetical protein
MTQKLSDRLRDFRTRFAARRSRGEMVDRSRDRDRASRPPDVTSPRAKSTGHGKVTADKWNQ